MKAATWVRHAAQQRLLVLHVGREQLTDAHLSELPRFLAPGDLLVVNDAATLPASLRGKGPGGAAVELRLLGSNPDGTWDAVLFGEGDWRTRTEDRPHAPSVAPGERIVLGTELQATVLHVDADTQRLLRLRFDRQRDRLWQGLYASGAPVQYAHVERALSLWHVQTPYAGRPWASEVPSAGRALTWEQLIQLRRGGVEIARLTHAAGLSSTGDATLDARLPLPERYEIPVATAAAWRQARERRGRIVAVGTSTARALESAVRAGGGQVVAGPGVAELVIGPGTERRACSGILTGIHEPGTSHARLLEAFAPPDLIARTLGHAERSGYLGHELGDSCLILEASKQLAPSGTVSGTSSTAPATGVVCPATAHASSTAAMKLALPAR